MSSPRPPPPHDALAPELDPSSVSGPRLSVSQDHGVEPPVMLGRYRIVEQLGAGGMGVVYKALDLERGQLVALKTLQRIDPAGQHRLKSEFRGAADVAHDNLVMLHELVSDGDDWFFTMELIDGEGFLDHVRGPRAPEGTLDEAGLGRLRAALPQLAAGVQALHAAGKLHRDLKPGNVMVARDGRVVILDFGLVTERRTSRSDETDPRRPGTPGYMAPEQALGDPSSAASDWFAVGVMIFEALTGTLPGRGPLVEPMPPSSRAPGAPSDLDALSVDLRRPLPSERPTGVEVLRRLGTQVPDDVADEDGPRLLGRKEELRVLEDAFLDVRDGASATVYIHGKSGMGKSALSRVFLDAVRAAGALVLEGRCYERETVPYKAFDAVIDELAAHLARLSPDALAEVAPDEAQDVARIFPALRRACAGTDAPVAAADEGDPNERQRRGFRALKDLLGRLALRAPIVIGIDDLQWGDLDSARLLDELFAPPAPASLLLVGTYRSEEVETSAMLREVLARRRPSSPRDGDADPALLDVSVGPLDAEDAERLAIAMARRDDPATRRRAREIARESEGNPFFVEQLVRYTEVGGAAPDVSLDGLVAARLARLPPPARRLLEVVAVTGRPVAQALVIEAAGVGIDARAALALLRSSSLVKTRGAHADDRVESYHDRIREAVSESIAADARAEHHARIAAALERAGDPDPEELASHLVGAGSPERARRYAIAAAERAETALAFERAAALYRLAATCEPRAAERVVLDRKRADALVHAGRCAEAAPLYLAAAADAIGLDAIELRRRAAEQLLVSGQIDEGIRVLGPVLEEVGLPYPATPGRAMVAVIARIVELELRGFSFRERRERDLPKEELQRLEVCWSAGKGLLSVDSIRAAYFLVRTLSLALAVGEPRRVVRGLAVYGMMNVYEGKPSGAKKGAKLLERAERIAKPLADPYLEGAIDICRGTASMSIGRWREGLETMERGIEILEKRCAGVAWECAAATSSCFNSRLWLGEIRAIERRAPAWRRDAALVGNLFSVVQAELYMAFARLAAGETAQARALCDEAIARWSHAGYHFQHWLALKIQVWCDLYAGDAAGAEARLEGEWPRYVASKLDRVQLMRIDAWLLRGQVAVAASRGDEKRLGGAHRAAVALERVGRPTATAGARLLRGCMAAALGDRVAAIRHLEAAGAGFATEGVALHAACASRRLAELGAGGGGAAAIASVDELLREAGVADPARWTAMVAPFSTG